jgi:hypothetical protein
MENKFLEAIKQLVAYGNREFLRSFQLRSEIIREDGDGEGGTTTTTITHNNNIINSDIDYLATKICIQARIK